MKISRDYLSFFSLLCLIGCAPSSLDRSTYPNASTNPDLNEKSYIKERENIKKGDDFKKRYAILSTKEDPTEMIDWLC